MSTSTPKTHAKPVPLPVQLANAQHKLAADKTALTKNAAETKATNQAMTKAAQQNPADRDFFESAKKSEDAKLATQRKSIEKNIVTQDKKIASLEKNPSVVKAQLGDAQKKLQSDEKALATSKSQETSANALARQIETLDDKSNEPAAARSVAQQAQKADARYSASQHGISRTISGDKGEIRTLDKELAKDKASGSGSLSLSKQAKQEMSSLVTTAQRQLNTVPNGFCLEAIGNYLQSMNKYGGTPAHPHGIADGAMPRLPEAKDAAAWLAANYKAYGLKRLDVGPHAIKNPYDAPEGSLIFVRAGTPGTVNHTAGDVTVKGPGDQLYNDTNMAYYWYPASADSFGKGVQSPSAAPHNFPPGNNYVLGIYAPA
jgi:hypothetical protein